LHATKLQRISFSCADEVGAGGDGTVEIADSGTIYRYSGNFLLRTRPLWLAQGFAVEILGAPNNTSLNGRRQTEAYADAIGRAVDFARTRARVPVWLVGTSAGTTGAANGAARLTGRLAGLVMTSSVSRRYNAGETVFDTELGAIAIPVLIVANRGDSCAVTPPDDAATIAAALTRSPRKEVVYVESDQIESPPCEAMSPHGYLAIEAAVVQRIADWIRRRQPSKPYIGFVSYGGGHLQNRQRRGVGSRFFRIPLRGKPSGVDYTIRRRSL